MEKRITFIAALFFLAGLTLPLYFAPIGQAQTEELSFENSFAEYQSAFEDYRIKHEDYVIKRSQYLRFKTQTAQTAARDATALMLQARDEVVIKYLLTLKARTNEAIGITQARRDSLNFKIDEEVAWFSDHKERVPSAGTLEDLVADSNEAKIHFERNEGLHYEVLANIGLGKVNDYTERTEDATLEVKEKIEQIRVEDREEYRFSDRKHQVLDRWVFEAETRIIRAKEKQAETENLIIDLASAQKGSGLATYNNVIKVMGESQLFLKEATSFLQEIIREIKTAED